MYRPATLGTVIFLVACSSDPLKAGREALQQGQHQEAVTAIRQALAKGRPSPEAGVLYEKALDAYREQLRQPNVTVETCDQAWSGLTALPGFAQGEQGLPGERELLEQALLCGARHRARQGKADDAARHVVQGMQQLPGFAPASPVLTKALLEPAEKLARNASAVNEVTALAQIIWSSGEHGRAVVLLDQLEDAGAPTTAIGETLFARAQAAPYSPVTLALAASFATWHDQPEKAAQWYEAISAQVPKNADNAGKALKHFAELRAEEATRLAKTATPACQTVADGLTLGTTAKGIAALAVAPLSEGWLAAWVEGTQRPQQQLKILKINRDGSLEAPLVLGAELPERERSPDDAQAAFAPKNREVSLALVPCNDALELLARGAPNGAWTRGRLGPDGAVLAPLTPVNRLGEKTRMPSEDVWWNASCANKQLVLMWLADTQLMRVAWFEESEAEGDPSDLRLPGFAPAFVALGREDGGTVINWVDILGEGQSSIVQVVLPPSHEVPQGEDGQAVASQPVVESIEGRVEQMRLTPTGTQLALTYFPQENDIMVRWLDRPGRPLGSPASLVHLRSDARGVRYDAAASPHRLGVVWTEALTEQHGTLYFQSFDHQGGRATTAQRLATLARPDTSPVIAGGEGAFAAAWVSRREPTRETIRLSLLRCDEPSTSDSATAPASPSVTP